MQVPLGFQQVQVCELFFERVEITRKRYHDRVVGREFGGADEEFRARFRQGVGEAFADEGIGRDAPACDDGARAVFFDGT